MVVTATQTQQDQDHRDAVLARLDQSIEQVVLQRLPLGVGVTLLGTSPVMALLVSRLEGDHPHSAGVIASLLAVSGVALAVLS